MSPKIALSFLLLFVLPAAGYSQPSAVLSKPYLVRGDIHLASEKGKCMNRCEEREISCIRKIPSDYQGHPGREANWKDACKSKSIACFSECGCGGDPRLPKCE